MPGAFKLKLSAAVLFGLAAPVAAVPFLASQPVRDDAGFVTLAAGAVTYRAPGDFTRNGKPAAAPIITAAIERPFAIMTHQVSSADYQHCVDDGGCRALPPAVEISAGKPAVQVSWRDADAYAAWLSRRSGQRYRLPTDAEWAYAAGSRFKDDGVAIDADDPSKRAIARYEAESNREQFPAAARPQPFGAFGANERGVSDLAGNVWEWTATCFTRSVLGDNGRIVSTHANCGVRAVEGQHRAYVTDFIRDARGGGCAVGVPPTNLGFRLVRETAAWRDMMAQRLAPIVKIAAAVVS